jgi:hypothetical protein
MSLTQTYYVASTARTKLGREASRADHDLRLLVGHANLLDSLMLELADAEREQEAWFDQSVHTAASKPRQPSHLQWVDTVSEEDDYSDDDSDLDSDDGSDIYDEDIDIFNISLKSISAPPVEVTSEEVYDDMDLDDEADVRLTLTRVPSNQHSPPELTLDSDSDSDDDSMLSASPEHSLYPLHDSHCQQLAPTTYYDMKASNTLLAARSRHPMIAAC